MKIAVDNNIRRYDLAYRSKIKKTDFDSLYTGKNTDRVIIGSGSSSISDKRIAGEAVHSVVKDVRTETSGEKIESLKQQIREGTYRPDAEKIVSRLLLEKG